MARSHAAKAGIAAAPRIGSAGDCGAYAAASSRSATRRAGGGAAPQGISRMFPSPLFKGAGRLKGPSPARTLAQIAARPLDHGLSAAAQAAATCAAALSPGSGWSHDDSEPGPPPRLSVVARETQAHKPRLSRAASVVKASAGIAEARLSQSRRLPSSPYWHMGMAVTVTNAASQHRCCARAVIGPGRG